MYVEGLNRDLNRQLLIDLDMARLIGRGNQVGRVNQKRSYGESILIQSEEEGMVASETVETMLMEEGTRQYKEW